MSPQYRPQTISIWPLGNTPKRTLPIQFYKLAIRWYSLSMEEPPEFIKQFSKEKSADERLQVANAIRAKRAEHFMKKPSLSDHLLTVRNLGNEIAGLATSGVGKMLDYFQLRKDQGELEKVSGKLKSEKPSPALQETKAMLDNFYTEQQKKWQDSGYTKEEITRYFSEEHLASLSLEDYALLLKRFPSEMVTHVTRQGIRDHYGHMSHMAGMDEYANGFMKMVADGRLRSPLGVYLVESEKNNAIARFLHLDHFNSREGTLNNLRKFTEGNEPASYADKTAIHFVLHLDNGGEDTELIKKQKIKT